VTFEQLIEQQRPHVERVAQDLARRHYLASSEIEEFRTALERALERNDYELLRAFDGRCTWETYLTTVVTREFFLFQAAMWGQWRPSSHAIRLGPAAMLLEELVLRDRFTLNDAIDWMRTSHRVDMPRHRLIEFAEELGMQVPGTADRRSSAARPSAADAALRHALRDSLALVSPDDRLILGLRFRDRQPLTRIAALLRTDVRPLQRRIDTLKNVIRESLLAQGIDACDVEALLKSAESTTATPQQHWWDAVLARLSRESQV
jgi:hypothetical protein